MRNQQSDSFIRKDYHLIVRTLILIIGFGWLSLNYNCLF